MTVAICTLFEKDYHYGVAALVNSLVRNGFNGTIVAGFRGDLPRWALEARPHALPRARHARILDLDSAKSRLLFWPLATSAHFTNYKPDFMLDVLAEESLGADTVFYLDPDIVLTTSWQFMTEWASCGIALCEDVNSPLMANHPRRIGWRRYFAAKGLTLTFNMEAYVNGGCVGVTRADTGFLEDWRTLYGMVSEAIGGPSAAKISGGTSLQSKGFASCFDCSDQDALNAAIELHGSRAFSVLPPTAMGFSPGAAILPHAIGAAKPWRRRYLRECVGGRPPTTADIEFWNYASGPISPLPRFTVATRRAALRIASGIGRFYRRR